MNREYHKWYSSRLGRDMEMLVIGYAGLPVLVFPTSGGRFYEFEDRGMIGAVGGRVERGDLQFFCVDSGALLGTSNTRTTSSTKSCR
jgi:esterase/lipase superfamily enzyme